jgi:hypothetical protein
LFALVSRLDSVPAHELIEPALFLVLVKKCQAVLFEFLEEVFPGDRLQLGFGAVGEVDAKQSRIATTPGSPYASRFPSAFLNPTLDFLVVSGDLRGPAPLTAI